jgi:hypothetical protein
VDPGFQEQIELLLEGMIAARALSPLRLNAQTRNQWCQTIVAALLPKLEPTLPLFAEDPAT